MDVIRMSIGNLEETIKFIEENFLQSGFLYGNVKNENSKTFLFKEKGKLLGIASVIYDKYCTYLFPK